MLERAFVLVPLADLVPDRVIRGVTVAPAAARAAPAGLPRGGPWCGGRAWGAGP